MTTTALARGRDAVFGGLPKVFWLLFSGQLVNRFGAMVLPFLVFYLGGKGFSPAEIAAVMSAYGVGGLGGQPIGGYLADRFGRKLTLIGGLLATAGCLMLIGLAGSLSWLVAGAVALGLMGDVYRPAASAMVAETTPAAERAKAFGLMHWAINVGAAISGAAAGLLLAQGYWLLVALDAGSSVAFAVLVAFGIPSDRPAPRAAGRKQVGSSSARDERARYGSGRGKRAGSGSAAGERAVSGSAAGERAGSGSAAGGRGGYGAALRDPVLVGCVLLVLIGLTVYGQVKFALPLSIAADGLPPSLFGLLITLNAAIIVVLQPVAVALLSRYRRLPVLGISIAVIGLGLALSGPADQVWQYVVTVIIWSAGELGMAAVEAVVIADLTPEGSHGTYQALYGWAAAVSRFAAPALGALLSVFGLGAVWWSCAILGVACLVVALVMVPAFARRAAEINS